MRTATVTETARFVPQHVVSSRLQAIVAAREINLVDADYETSE